MRARHAWRSAIVLAAIGVLAAACGGDGDDGGGGTGPPTGSISITLASSQLVVAQGQAASTQVTLTRGGSFAGAVDITVEGAPAGITVAPLQIPSGTTSNTLSIAVAASVPAGTHSLTVRARGQGVTDVTATLTIQVNVAAGFTLGMAPASLALQQGASGTAEATLTRVGAFAAPVTLTVTGAPTGVTVTPASQQVTGLTASFSVQVSPSAAPGSYSLTVRGTATGVTDQTATLTLLVSAVSGASVSIRFCEPDVPIWLAARAEGGDWSRVTGDASGTYTFGIGARGAVAALMSSGGDYELTVVHATANELAALGPASAAWCASPSSGDRTLTGSVVGLAAAQLAGVSLGDASAVVMGGGPGTFQLSDAPNRAADLIALRYRPSTTDLFAERAIVRRALDLPSGAAIPTLDFGAAEAFATEVSEYNVVTVGNLAGDASHLTYTITTGNGTSALLALLPGRGVGFQFPTLPTARQLAGDMYQALVLASPPGDDTRLRGAVQAGHDLAFFGLNLGPALATPVITTVAGTPARMRAQLPVQTQYAGSVLASFEQEIASGTHRDVLLVATAGYLGGATSWDLTIPDLAAAGFDPNWGLRTGLPIEWSVTAYSGGFLQQLGYQLPTSSNGEIFAGRSSSGSVSLVQPSLLGARDVAKRTRRMLDVLRQR